MKEFFGIIKDLLDWLPDTFLSKYTHLYMASIVFILSQSILYYISKNSPKEKYSPMTHRKDKILCASLVGVFLWLRFSKYPSVFHTADMALTIYYAATFLIVFLEILSFFNKKAKK